MQAYQKRALDVIAGSPRSRLPRNRRLNVRLVKGAYWDSEVKRAQERGLTGYPVFTRKVNTDVSYIACARALIAAGPEHLSAVRHAQCADGRDDHRARRARPGASSSSSACMAWARSSMRRSSGRTSSNMPCRVYAPVGSHEDLLPYLVRRLLENGANTSFVNRIVDEQTAIDDIVRDPVLEVDALKQKAHPRIPPPRLLYGASRLNSRGVNLADPAERDALDRRHAASAPQQRWDARPDRRRQAAAKRRGVEVRNPANLEQVIGSTVRCGRRCRSMRHFASAVRAQLEWDATPASERAEMLERAADLFEERMPELIAYCVREGGRSIPDSIAEVREAVDFLRYYADRARTEFGAGRASAGPDGREQRAAAARPRSVRVHQSVEFSARDFHRADCRRRSPPATR